MAARREAGLPLSRRELEVARLVADGLTDQQAARRLGLSLRTVNCHLWNIYAKTGTGSRTKLLTWLSRNTAE